MDLQPLLRALELDLAVEHEGHLVRLTGAGGRFLVRFPTLSSLIHFGRVVFPARKQFPSGFSVRLEWRGLGFRVNH